MSPPLSLVTSVGPTAVGDALPIKLSLIAETAAIVMIRQKMKGAKP